MIASANKITGMNVPIDAKPGQPPSRAQQVLALGKSSQPAQAAPAAGSVPGAPGSAPLSSAVGKGVGGAISGVMSNLQKNSQAGFQGVSDAIAKSASDAKNPDIIKGGEGILGDALHGTASGIEAIASPVTTAFQEGSSIPVPGTGGHNIGDVFNAGEKPVTDAIASIPALQKFVTANPNAPQHVQDAITVLSSFLGGKAPEAAESGLDTAASGVEAAKPAVNAAAGKIADVARDAVDSTKNAASNASGKLADTVKNQEVANWSKPTNTPKAAYNKAADIYNNAKSSGHDISNTLVNNGIKISDNVGKNSSGNDVYDTKDTAAKLRSDTQKFSNETIRPALEEADKTTPKTPVSNVIQQAIDSVKSNKSLVGERKSAIIDSLDATKKSLTTDHPEGMSLTDMHNEKIVRDLNSKYNTLGDIASNNEAFKNKAVGDALRKTLENSTPEEIPIKDFNRELQKQYQAANYLDALHGKVAPRSIASNIARTGGKILGAVAGKALGGGLLGEVGGYHIGGMIESMLEGIPEKARGMLMNNLEKQNPEAFQKIQDYLEKTSQ